MTTKRRRKRWQRRRDRRRQLQRDLFFAMVIGSADGVLAATLRLFRLDRRHWRRLAVLREEQKRAAAARDAREYRQHLAMTRREEAIVSVTVTR